MKAAAAILAALVLGLGGFVLGGCSNGRNGPNSKTTGVNQKPPQPTTGTAGTKAPTPPASTSTTG
ncbi:MAG TPA: hypothetical protein VIU44_15975 [Gaiellaceae bacterium]